jgi:hypothetical protein
MKRTTRKGNVDEVEVFLKESKRKQTEAAAAVALGDTQVRQKSTG